MVKRSWREATEEIENKIYKKTYSINLLTTNLIYETDSTFIVGARPMCPPGADARTCKPYLPRRFATPLLYKTGSHKIITAPLG